MDNFICGLIIFSCVTVNVFLLFTAVDRYLQRETVLGSSILYTHILCVVSTWFMLVCATTNFGAI